MISGLRIARRVALAAPVTALAYGWALAASLLLAPWPRARVRQQGVAYRFWCRTLCRLFSIRIRTEGSAPSPPFFLVSNHLSYLDILVLGTALPCVFVAKAEIDRWPLFGALCRSVNTIFIDRKAKRELPRVLERIGETLRAGQGVVIFPEGTSGAGHEVREFRSPLLDLPAKLALPVHCAALGYRVPDDSPPAYLSVAWWGDMPLGPHLRLMLALPWVEASLRFADSAVAEPDRKLLARRLRSEVVGRFEPLAPPEEVAPIASRAGADPAFLVELIRRAARSQPPR